jgi:F-type H+-transporting ATPase subunit b
MVTIVNVTLLRPINRILAKRDRLTKGRLREAAAVLMTVDEKVRQYESRLREARAQGYRVMERARMELTREREQRIGEVKAEVTRWILEQKKALSSEAELVRKQLKVDSQARALEISRQILRGQVSGDWSSDNRQS